MARKFRKISVSLPITLVDDLDVISAAFRVTRSALLTQIMTEAAVSLRSISEQHILPMLDAEGDSKESVRAIESTLDRLALELEQVRNATSGIKH